MKPWNDPEATFEEDVLPLLKAWEQYRLVLAPEAAIAVLSERWPDWRERADTARWRIKDDTWNWKE